MLLYVLIFHCIPKMNSNRQNGRLNFNEYMKRREK